MKWYGSYDVLDNEGFTETSRLTNLKDQRTRVEEAAKRTQRKEWSLKRLGNVSNSLHEHESEVEAILFLSICVACKYKTLPKSLVLFPQDLIKKISGGGQWEELGSKDWDSYYLFLSEWMFQENI